MSSREEENSNFCWMYPHIKSIKNTPNCDYVDFDKYLVQEKYDGANVAISFKFSTTQCGNNIVEETLWSRHQKLGGDLNKSKFFNIHEPIHHLRNFLNDVHSFVLKNLKSSDVLILNFELYGRGVITRINYNLPTTSNRLICYDCRINGVFLNGFEFLKFQKNFLNNETRYTYWPFIVSFMFGELLNNDEINTMIEQNKLIHVDLKTNKDEFDLINIQNSISQKIISTKEGQNQIEGVVFKPLTSFSPSSDNDEIHYFKWVFTNFLNMENNKKIKLNLKEANASLLTPYEIKILNACDSHLIKNCYLKKPWTNINNFFSNVINDLQETVREEEPENLSDKATNLDYNKIQNTKILKTKIIELIKTTINLSTGKLIV